MKFSVEKFTKGHFIPVLEGNRCKEEYIFQLYVLGFHNQESPTKTWFEYLDTNFTSHDAMREFYVCETNKWFEQVAGWKVFFSNKREAQKYVDTLNTKIQELGL